ncbi:TetR/AcrR family transcriptional regulator [Deinococcus sp.]|uniref:TetR/AcrR family transcriptional regulator n=1 Tax=Deinococcus sp. TaxID=47478 RepID=UPI003C7BE000
MGRPPNPQARADLLIRVTAYVLEHGLSDLSLRPLAGVLGVSPRLLLYHFGSKEQLVVDVLATVASQQQAALSRLDLSVDPVQRFEQLWVQLTSAAFTPFLRSLFEVELRAMAGEQRYRQFADHSVRAWNGVVVAHLRNAPSPTAHLVLSALTGLLIDRFSTGDERRTDEAFHALKGALIAGGFL